MATHNSDTNTRTSTASETIALGDASPGTVSSYFLHVQGNGWTGTLILYGAGRHSGLTPITLPYQNLQTAGDVAAGTAISADGLYIVRADGMDITLVHAWVAGSVRICIIPLIG